MTSAEREVAFVESFVVSAKRERYAEFVRSPKRRQKFIRELYHFSDFDPGCVVAPPGALDANGLLEELRLRGAADTCYVMSVDGKLDGVIEPLSDVIDAIYGFVEGTLVCCVPGKLGYYEGEGLHNRFILQRPTR